jgi:hypothetical protein
MIDHSNNTLSLFYRRTYSKKLAGFYLITYSDEFSNFSRFLSVLPYYLEGFPKNINIGIYRRIDGFTCFYRSFSRD